MYKWKDRKKTKTQYSDYVRLWPDPYPNPYLGAGGRLPCKLSFSSSRSRWYHRRSSVMATGLVITAVITVLAIIDILGNTLVCLIIKRNRDMRWVVTKICNTSKVPSWKLFWISTSGRNQTIVDARDILTSSPVNHPGRGFLLFNQRNVRQLTDAVFTCCRTSVHYHVPV